MESETHLQRVALQRGLTSPDTTRRAFLRRFGAMANDYRERFRRRRRRPSRRSASISIERDQQMPPHGAFSAPCGLLTRSTDWYARLACRDYIGPANWPALVENPT